MNEDYGLTAALKDAGLEVVPSENNERILPVDIDDATEENIEFFGVSDSGSVNETAAPVQNAISPDVAALLQNQQALLQNAYAQRAKSAEERAAALEERLAALESHQPKDASPPAAPWWESLGVKDLDPAQRERFKESLPVIETVAAQKALEIVKQMQSAAIDPMNERIQKMVQPLQDSLIKQQEYMAKSQDAAYTQALNKHAPWLQSELNSPAYAKFYNTPVPHGGGLTYGNLLQQAEQMRNVDAVLDILSAYKPQQRQPLPTQTAPGRANAAAYSQVTNHQTGGRKKGVRFSDYQRAIKQFSDGTMSNAKFQQWEDAWNAALIDGTAVMD